MDDIVVRAMQKWPGVPEVYGWLRLDRRGRWWVKGASGAFERIGNPAVVEFIGRNYERDERGRWFFQNGPQRVFVALDYTPWVYRLGDANDALVTHTGRPAGRIDRLLADEAGALLAAAGPGVGVIDDRDMALIAEAIGDDPERLPPEVRLLGQVVPVESVRAADLPARFGFDPTPSAPPGAPDC